ncbi:MAG: hypothetical protein FJW86_01800 [Actinobacteria bacterium]|nr:hypothetical protein [Actinomycetota bacterium]
MASFAGHEGHDLYFIRELIRRLLSVDQPLASNQLGAEMLAEIGAGFTWGFEDELREASAGDEGGLWGPRCGTALLNVGIP